MTSDRQLRAALVEMGKDPDEVNSLMKERGAYDGADQAQVEAPVADDSMRVKPVAGGQTTATRSAKAAADTAAEGGSTVDTVGAGLTTAGAATANPYLLAAGLGLQVLSASSKKEDEKKRDRYKAQLAQQEARQSAINNLAQISSGLRL